MDSLIYQTSYLKGRQSPISRINANTVQNKKSTVESTTLLWGGVGYMQTYIFYWLVPSGLLRVNVTVIILNTES